MSKVYIVGRQDASGNFSFADQPKQHFSEKSAIQETERLARCNVGKTYVYAEIKGLCTVGATVWKRG